MSPMYNPDDWNQEFDLTLKYEPMNEHTINKILNQYKHEEILDYIKKLWNLIDYQRQMIAEQTKQIVAIKHKTAWKRYDLPESKFKEKVDNPPKNGNMSC